MALQNIFRTSAISVEAVAKMTPRMRQTSPKASRCRPPAPSVSICFLISLVDNSRARRSDITASACFRASSSTCLSVLACSALSVVRFCSNAANRSSMEALGGTPCQTEHLPLAVEKLDDTPVALTIRTFSPYRGRRFHQPRRGSRRLGRLKRRRLSSRPIATVRIPVSSKKMPQ